MRTKNYFVALVVACVVACVLIVSFQTSNFAQGLKARAEMLDTTMRVGR